MATGTHLPSVLLEPPVLLELEAAAYNLAKGRDSDLGSLIAALGVARLRGGAPLVTILRATSTRISEPTARRQFFHAARALVSLHRADPARGR